VLDLTAVPTLGDLTGQNQVWVALVFESDFSNTHAEGAYVDNILLRKCTSSCRTGRARSQVSTEGRLLHLANETLGE
jgi:hypothetical protein